MQHFELLQKLILAGGDGTTRTRSGFKHEVVEALLSLIALQDAQFKRNPNLKARRAVKSGQGEPKHRPVACLTGR